MHNRYLVSGKLVKIDLAASIWSRPAGIAGARRDTGSGDIDDEPSEAE